MPPAFELNVSQNESAGAIIIMKINDFVIPVGIERNDIPGCFGPEVPCEEQADLLEISNIVESDIINADMLHEKLKKVDTLITFDEVWTIIDYMRSVGDGTVDFREFMYAISHNTPTVAHIYRTTFNNRQWEVFTAINRFIRMHKWVTPLQRLTKTLTAEAREVRWNKRVYERRISARPSKRKSRNDRYKLTPPTYKDARSRLQLRLLSAPKRTTLRTKGILKQPKNEPEIGRVFVSSLEQRSSFGYAARRYTSHRGACDVRNVVPLPRVTTKKDDLDRIIPEERRRKWRDELARYTDDVQEFYVNLSLKRWNEMHVDDIPSPVLQERFREVFANYSPSRKQDVFVTGPYTPPPLSMSYFASRRRFADPTMSLSQPPPRRNARREILPCSAEHNLIFTPLRRDDD